MENMPMINRNTALKTNGFTGTALILWQNTYIRTILQLMFLLTMGVVTTLGKKASLPLGIPGHSAVFWLGAMVLGRAILRKDGAGTIMGASVAFWGIPFGLNNVFMHNLWLYGLTGLALDLASRIPKISIRNPLGALLCGMIAHMVKFSYILVIALTSATTAHFMIFGVLQSAGLHLLFGALAGIIGWWAYWCLNKIKNSLDSSRS
jgi:hypothetical protein